MKYEILEDLFLFEESQGEEEDNSALRKMPLAKATTSQLSLYEQLEKEAFRITGNKLDDEDNNNERLSSVNKTDATERCWFFCSGRTQPKGKIQVYNTNTKKTEPVIGVKVRTYRWFVWGHGYTNSNGNYTINKKYRGNPWYFIDFDNPSNYFKLYSSWLSFSDATYTGWTQSKNGYNVTFSTNSYGWRFATVNNAIVKHRLYCKELGISTFNSNIRVNVTSGIGDAAAPMLKHVKHPLYYNSGTWSKNFVINLVPATIANSIGYIARFGLLPDAWVQAGSRNTEDVYSDIFHEMSHTSHYAKVGSFYWSQYINYIITYGSYGNGTGKNAGYCGVGEMWGNYFGAICMDREFRTNKGLSSFVGLYLNETREWFNPGYLEDVDNISDITTKEIFDCLKSTTFENLRRELKTKTTQDEKIDKEFYDYSDWP